MNPLPISCYIRTKNEEARIGKVVEAAKKLCAEVLVIDSHSTDRTREVAEQAGAVVVVNDWLGYGYQKRVGEQHATHDWVLDLDADEMVSVALADEIRDLMQSGSLEDVYALKMVTVSPLGNIWEDNAIAWRNKLYRKSVYQMPEHEAWDQLDLPKDMKVSKLKSPYYHYSFLSISDLMVKMNSASDAMAKAKKLKPLPVLRIRIIFGFWSYFFKKFVKQQMYKEGVYGFACAAVIAAQRWLTDVKMYEMHRGLKNEMNIM